MGPGTVLENNVCVAEQQQKGGGCLIATAAFGSEMAPQVQFLREIRDGNCVTNTIRISIYDRIQPILLFHSHLL